MQALRRGAACRQRVAAPARTGYERQARKNRAKKREDVRSSRATNAARRCPDAILKVFQTSSRAFPPRGPRVAPFAATPAMAEFGLEKFAISARNQNGTPDVQAGSHPVSR